ncbi:MAG: delta-60 repeat domain-containing protein [Flavobacteriales bacterium]|nr:delta-60 repeat domain-containing protein [Flavobacteriales bacterium]
MGAVNGILDAIVVQPDDGILIGGMFTTVHGQPRSNFARLLPDGTLDPAFCAAAFANFVLTVAVQADGKILVGGIFLQVNGIPRGRIARLNADGTLDNTFAPVSGANALVRTILPLPDGRILVGGAFTQFNGVARNGFAMLNANGSLDPSFVPSPLAPFSEVRALAMDNEGRFLVGGTFSTTGSGPQNDLVRLFPDGSLDASFNSGNGATGDVEELVVLSDGSLLVAGDLIALNGVGRNRVVRLNASEPEPPLLVSAKVLLGSAYEGSLELLRDDLRVQDLLPLAEPYTALGYPHAGDGGGETIDPALLITTGPDAIVDWVVVELRAAATPGNVLATRAGLVQRDGDVVSSEGLLELAFDLPSAAYHVALRHRNHLGVMTAAPVALSPAPVTIDFTDPFVPTFGVEARNEVGGDMVLWPGDANFDGRVKYVGAANDRDAILVAVGGSTPANTVQGVYATEDVNLDGTIEYVGVDNDRDIILETVGGIPTYVKVEQLP